MAEETIRLIQRRLRSPRSAAFAGIIFSLLLITSMVLTFEITSAVPADINREWLETWSSTASVVLTIVDIA